MSQLAHAQTRLVRHRPPLRLTLAAVALIAGAAIALFFVISADDEAIQTPNTVVSDTAAGIRYDGGPEEGTANASASRPRVTGLRAFPGVAGQATGDRADGLRYDGGPEDGSRGSGH